MDLNFDEDECINAANECSTLYTAISYLQQECELCASKYPVKEVSTTKTGCRTWTFNLISFARSSLKTNFIHLNFEMLQIETRRWCRCCTASTDVVADARGPTLARKSAIVPLWTRCVRSAKLQIWPTRMWLGIISTTWTSCSRTSCPRTFTNCSSGSSGTAHSPKIPISDGATKLVRN